MPVQLSEGVDVYAFQIQRHGSDVNGNSRWAVVLMAEDSREVKNSRGVDVVATSLVPRIRLVGGKDMRDECARHLPRAGNFSHGDWLELPDVYGVPSRKAQRTTTHPREQVLPWHLVADRLEDPAHVLIAQASLRADDIAKSGAR